MSDKRVSSLFSLFFETKEGCMTSHEGQYKSGYPLAKISKGPGTKALQDAKPGDVFSFDGRKLVEGEYYLPISKKLLEAHHLDLDSHTWVLWFSTANYPHWVERMVYNSHNRSGLLEMWEKKLSPHATAEERAEHADAGTTMEMPVWMLWYMSVVSGLLAWAGWHFGTSDNLWGLLIIFALASVEFAGMAIWKWERDGFWRALDMINALDLRRPPNDSK